MSRKPPKKRRAHVAGLGAGRQLFASDGSDGEGREPQVRRIALLLYYCSELACYRDAELACLELFVLQGIVQVWMPWCLQIYPFPMRTWCVLQ